MNAVTVTPDKAHALHSYMCALEKASRAYKQWASQPSPKLRQHVEHRAQIAERYRLALVSPLSDHRQPNPPGSSPGSGS